MPDPQPNKRIEEARKTVAAARSALEKAEAALRAGEKVSAQTAALRDHPLVVIAGVLAVVGALTVVLNLFASKS